MIGSLSALVKKMCSKCCELIWKSKKK